MDALGIWRAAQATIQAYGDGAGLHAAQRADELPADGDMEGRRMWLKQVAAQCGLYNEQTMLISKVSGMAQKIKRQ